MKINWRTWHAWLSVILSLPLFIIGVTAVFIAHGKTLGLNMLDVDALWLPGYTVKAPKQEPIIIKAVFTTDDTQYIGIKTGLIILRAGQAEVVAALRGAEVRSIAAAAGKFIGRIGSLPIATLSPSLVVVGAKTGVWLGNGNDWQKIYADEVFTAGTLPDGTIFASLLNGGMITSQDSGQTWSHNKALTHALAQLPAVHDEVNLTMNKLIMDLHTGKAFLGKHWEWLWIDILGVIMIFLSLSGVYLWWMGQRRKALLATAGWQHP